MEGELVDQPDGDSADHSVDLDSVDLDSADHASVDRASADHLVDHDSAG